VPVILVIFKSKLNLLDRFSKNTQIWNSIKIRPVEGKLIHADGRTDRQDEANSSYSQFCESALNGSKWDDDDQASETIRVHWLSRQRLWILFHRWPVWVWTGTTTTLNEDFGDHALRFI